MTKKISELTTGTPVIGDKFEFETAGGLSKQCDLSALRARGALVTKSADQTAANFSSRTAIPFDAEAYDTDSIHSNVTNNTRLSVPTGVSYVRLTATVQLGSYAGNFANLAIWKNGAGFDAAPYVLAYGNTAGAIWLNLVSPVLNVTGGTDYFELMLEVNGDTSITVNKTSSSFAMEIIA